MIFIIDNSKSQFLAFCYIIIDKEYTTVNL